MRGRLSVGWGGASAAVRGQFPVAKDRCRSRLITHIAFAVEQHGDSGRAIGTELTLLSRTSSRKLRIVARTSEWLKGIAAEE